jgi:hypothetical protein
MADEKILAEEIMDEDELEEVAGGTTAETKDDRRRLLAMGYYEIKPHQNYAVGIANALEKLGKDTGYDFKFTSSSHMGTESNSYQFNGKEVTREKFWKLVDEFAKK